MRNVFSLAVKVFHKAFSPGNDWRKGGNVTLCSFPSRESRGTPSETGGTRPEKSLTSPEAAWTRA